MAHPEESDFVVPACCSFNAKDLFVGFACKEWAPRGRDLCGADSHCSLKATSEEVSLDTCIGISVFSSCEPFLYTVT